MVFLNIKNFEIFKLKNLINIFLDIKSFLGIWYNKGCIYSFVFGKYFLLKVIFVV